MVEERNKNGKYKNINDFCLRLDDENINVRQLEFLIKSGSFDELDSNRANLFNNIDKIVQIVRDNSKNVNQNNLFSNNPDNNNIINFNFKGKQWSKSVTLNYEQEALGFYLSEHPLEDFKVFLKKNNFLNYNEIESEFNSLNNEEKKFFKIAALPVDLKVRTSKKGNKYAYVQFSDYTGSFEAIVFSDILNSSSDLIKNHELLLMTLEIYKRENNINLRVQDITTLRQFINDSNKKVKILTDEKIDISKLKKDLDRYKTETGSEIKLIVNVKEKIATISIPGKYDFFNIINNKSEDIKFLN